MALLYPTGRTASRPKHDVLLTREGGDVTDIRFDWSEIRIDHRPDGIKRHWDRRTPLREPHDVAEAEQVRARTSIERFVILGISPVCDYPWRPESVVPTNSSGYCRS